MRVSARKLSWGILFILLGVVALLVNLGYLHWQVWGNLLALWPVLIVAVGLRILFRGTRLVYLAPLVLALAVALAVFQTVVEKPARSEEGAWGQSRFSEPMPPGATGAEVELDVNAARLKVSGGSSGLIEGVATGWSGMPDVERREKGGGRISVHVSQVPLGRWLWRRGPRSYEEWRSWPRDGRLAAEEWDVMLTEAVPVSLSLDGGALTATMDLSAVNVTELDMDVGASTIDIRLGDHGVTTRARLDAGASKIIVRLPRTLGLSVSVSSGLSSTNLSELGLVRSGGRYLSGNWESARGRLDMHMSAGVTRLEVVYTESGSV